MEPWKDKGDESAITPFDIRNGVILTRRALSTPDLPPSDYFFISDQATATWLIVEARLLREKLNPRIKWHRCGSSFDQVSPSFRDKAYMGEAEVGIQAS